MTQIATDNELASDAERLLQITAELREQVEETREIAFRLLERFPGDGKVAAAVEQFLERAQNTQPA